MTWRLGRRPGLDGLRGVAILLVLAAHATSTRWLENAGSVGVTVFFGLSGFLITALLLDEREATGRISWSGFYKRRARRLLPVLVAYLTVSTVAGLFVPPLHLMAGDILPVLLYFENWVMVSHGAMIPASIAWSLSVEEQFYLLWPLTFLLARRWPRLPLYSAVFGIVTSVALRLALWDGGDGARRIYYASFTRMDCLAAGCLLALLVKRYGVPDQLARLAWPGAGLLVALVLIPSAPLHYLGEPLLASAAACLLIVGVLAGGSGWLAWGPLRWFGKRSYALYLWHYPLVWCAANGYALPMWAALAASLALAEASWWCIERPLTKRRPRPVAVEAVVVPA